LGIRTRGFFINPHALTTGHYTLRQTTTPAPRAQGIQGVGVKYIINVLLKEGV